MFAYAVSVIIDGFDVFGEYFKEIETSQTVYNIYLEKRNRAGRFTVPAV